MVTNQVHPTSMTTSPHWLKGYLSSEQLKPLAEKIAEKEKNTSVEIITMVVHSSSTGQSIWSRPAFWPLFLILLVLGYEIRDLIVADLGYLGHALASVVILFGSFVLSAQFSKCGWFYRLFSSDDALEAQAKLRAELEFYRHGLNETQGQTGILIFVSLLEHQVVVLADKAISSRLPTETWSSLVKDLVENLKSKKLYEGFLGAVEKSAALVTPIFPAGSQNPNEIADYLIIKE